METELQVTKTRKTSVIAYHEINENGLLSLRRRQVYNILYHHGPLTAGEVFALGLKHNVWSRAVKGGICSCRSRERDLQGQVVAVVENAPRVKSRAFDTVRASR